MIPIKTGLDQILGFGEGFERILPTQIGEEQNIPFMVGFLFDKIPVMRNVLLSSARLNYFIYLAALRLLEARVDCWTAVLVSVVVCITIPMIVNNLGLVSSQICMRFCQTSSATTETSHNSHLASRIVVVGRNFYKLAG